MIEKSEEVCDEEKVHAHRGGWIGPGRILLAPPSLPTEPTHDRHHGADLHQWRLRPWQRECRNISQLVHFRERRLGADALHVASGQWQTSVRFEDGQVLWR